ncbi:MAG: glucosamine-6-phosphate deaminase [Oscillospiraceae bacterium]|nr:glucosamine-6-phosphate deaminase [Oscillospiraceae bacterium]
MNFIKVKDYNALSVHAAEIICAQVNSKPNSVLGLATGSTPIGAYEQIREMYKRGEVDFSAVKTINLDEYVGLSPENAQSYRYFMNNQLFNGINIAKENTHLPDGMSNTVDDECARYERLIDSLGPIDLQLLGIGNNGHIGFNEPGDFFIKECHCTQLAAKTIEANSRFFDTIDEVPKKAITVGMGTVMAAKKVLLIAAGKEKAEIINKALTGKITPQVPASILQFHADLTVVVSP